MIPGQLIRPRPNISLRCIVSASVLSVLLWAGIIAFIRWVFG